MDFQILIQHISVVLVVLKNEIVVAFYLHFIFVYITQSTTIHETAVFLYGLRK